MINYSLAEETLGYQTSSDPSNTDRRLLIAGSKNVMIDYQRKVRIRPGYFRLGAANPALNDIRNAWTWNTSTGVARPQRFYDDELEVYIGTLDETGINAWTRVKDGWSTTEKLRPAVVFDGTEKIDLQIMVQGDANLYEWNGAIAVVLSSTPTTVTKAGTNTFAQNRFYTTRNKAFICVRTGTEYAYTAGESTTTLTSVSTSGSYDLVAGDILMQKVVTQSNKPGSNRTNHTIHGVNNQILVASEDDSLVFVSKTTNYADFAFSSPRASGEGALITSEGPTRAINSLGGTAVVFSSNDFILGSEFKEITVGSTLAETLTFKPVHAGVNQGALNHECVVKIGNALAFLSNEVALRMIEDPNNLTGINPKTLSNPIKPDFDTEDWTNAFGTWYKNILIFTAPATSHMFMLNYVEDADGKLLRYWNPPQIMPVGAMSIIDSGDGPLLHGHSNSVPETYLLFSGQSDGQFTDMEVEDKLPIDAKAVYAYDNFKKRANYKTFDEYFVEGEITPNVTDLAVEINYDFDGSTQIINEVVNAADEDILEGEIDFNSLGQQPQAINPLGGLLNPPLGTRKFRVIFDEAREDFFEISASFSTNDIDRYWAIISHGSNSTISPRRPLHKHK